MARVLYNDQWYEPLSPGAIYETEFEDQILSRASLFYPQYIAAPFKTVVQSEEGSAKADFALIHREYREWWVVEAEMGYHSFESHVLPQIRTLSKAVYAAAEADFLCKKCPELSRERMLALMKGAQPRVLVVVIQPMPSWVEDLRRYNAALNIIEVFRSNRNEYLFRMNGETILAEREVLSECALDPLLPRFLKVTSPAVLGLRHGAAARVYIDDKISEWEYVEAKDMAWLVAKRDTSLLAGKTYEIIRHEHGDLVIKPKIEKRKRLSQ